MELHVLSACTRGAFAVLKVIDVVSGAPRAWFHDPATHEPS